MFSHALVDQRKEFAGEIGAAPFPGTGVHVEGVEVVPVLFREIASGEQVECDAACRNSFAFLPDVFAF